MTLTEIAEAIVRQASSQRARRTLFWGSAAAILAKTVRDALMHRLAMRHPGYGWHTNVGYGTEEHQEGLQALGPTRHHRLTFSPLAQLTLSL